MNTQAEVEDKVDRSYMYAVLDLTYFLIARAIREIRIGHMDDGIRILEGIISEGKDT